MTYTKSRHLVIAGLIAAVLVYFAVRVGYGDLPRLPLLAGATLLVIAVVDAILALVLRPRIQRRQGTEPVDPMTATRAVALAKASSMAGAIMCGVWLGLLAYLLPMFSDVQAARSDTGTAIVGMVSAGALIAAGLWLEFCLRNPDEPEEQDEENE
ncbi:DUF3180 domain-containing protein [Haloactinomyces albus]|uniref:MFS superfamily sulfate permease-like transporter n=1 Tax=Haloactinomyces albus TaxID=1352928 RepID=A0AAE4CLC9_9ACTN|nr:DUF3180 domain-containing protein [Haloactinomyces albus]MDR7301689.1 MFS superfamily sulfate permease-like transporter [Haloactinomyces albus]